MRCSHASAVPVESVVTEEVLAALCPDCDVQLSAEFLTCPHENVIDITSLGEVPGCGICNDCGTSAWFDQSPNDRRAVMVAQLIAEGYDPASARRAIENDDPTLLIHTAFERPQAVITFGQDLSAEGLAEFEARFRDAQKEHQVLFLPTVASLDAPTPGEMNA